MYNILLKDDYAIYRKGINEILRSRFPFSGITEVDSAIKLADNASRQNWDIIIFDIADLSGKNFQLLSTLKQACPESRLIVTTDAENLLLKNALIAGGASACIAKDCSIEDFIKAIDKATGHKQAFV
ncbi:MAG: response regulator [Agriterribacter sp.]